MRAINIDIKELVEILTQLQKKKGINRIDFLITPDENSPKINKLIIEPVEDGEERTPQEEQEVNLFPENININVEDIDVNKNLKEMFLDLL